MSRYDLLSSLLAAALLLLNTTVQADIVAYTDETAFLNDIAGLGYDAFQEDFEDDAVWGAVRSTIAGGPHTAVSVRSRDLVWSANNPEGEVTTGSGAAYSGSWGFYTLPHGNYATGVDCNLAENCGDGFVASSEMTLYAVGGWIRANTPPAKIGLFLGGYPNGAVDFGETCPVGGGDCSDNAIIGATPHFYGVIDPGGFNRFEFRELEGTTDDQKFVFFDLFSVVAACPTWICPSGMSSGWRVIVQPPAH